MKATINLCDYAAAAEGKLTLVGVGWTFTGPAPSTMGIGVTIEVPWDRANERHNAVIELLDADGQSVSDPAGEPVVVRADFEVGRPPGHPAGTPIETVFAFNINGLPLEPAHRFVWQLSLDGATDEHWQVAFNTRPIASPSLN